MSVHIPVTGPGAWHGCLPSPVHEVAELLKPGGGGGEEEKEENVVLFPDECKPSNIPRYSLFVSPCCS